MHRYLNQDFNKNVSKEGWNMFEKKNKTYVIASFNVGRPYPEMPYELLQKFKFEPLKIASENFDRNENDHEQTSDNQLDEEVA